MITRIKFKHPLWIMDPDDLHLLLERVEREMGGAWEPDSVIFGNFWRVYAVTRFEHTTPNLAAI